MLKKVNIKYKELRDNTEEDLKIEEKKLSNVKTQINNINKAIIDGFYNPEMKKQMDTLQTEKEVIEHSISLIKNVSNKSEITSVDINNIINNDLLSLESDNLEHIKNVVQKYVREVIITPETIDIKIVLDDTNITGDNHGGDEES